MYFEQSTTINAPREAVWDLLADTDKLDREVGLPPIRFQMSPREAGGSDVYASVTVAGVKLRYREHPFDWVRPAFYHVRRTFDGGLLKEIVGGSRLEEEGTRTRVVVWAEFEPRNAVGTVLARAMGPKMIADVLGVCGTFDAYLSRRANTPYPRHSARPPIDRPRLQQSLERLKAAGGDAALADRLGDYLASAPPGDVANIRPFELADRWGMERMALLRTCLLAARQPAEMLEMQWRVLCPYCRGAPNVAQHLHELGQTTHCEACNIRFDTAFDESVEVCFAVAPRLRKVEAQTFCIGGPGNTPHVVAQWYLGPGESRETEVDLPPGRYTLTSLQAAEALPLTITPGEQVGAEVRLEADGHKARLWVATDTIGGRGSWIVTNSSGEAVVLRLETPGWTTNAATAALVTSLQAFRDQFSGEVLSPGTEIAVRQICILFSDLKGSTAMYRYQGDAPSYKAVREHFALMRRVISEHDGAIVKTIGDAVMASFLDPADGVASALHIQREARNADDGLVVKLGLHSGPAIAVTANDLLDYFGQTVNLAARLQRESSGGDVVMAAALGEDPRVARLLQESGAQVERFEASVRGLNELVPMLRLTMIEGKSNS
jgi:adenylate cyclase